MLTINQIVAVYESGVDVSIRKKNNPSIKGEYDPSTLEINLFPENNASSEDFEITILHEFIHARDDVRSARNSFSPELNVENEAKETYFKKRYVLDFIKLLYRLKRKQFSFY